MNLDLTIAIPVKNESQLIAGCLDAIGQDLAKQVVVIDSGSTDDTIAIAEAKGATVIHFNWDGRFPKKRNWYLRHHPPTTKWVLFLDADEFLTPAFIQALRHELPASTKAGYWLQYTRYFLGKQLKGGYPLKKLALFQPTAGEYEYIAEQQWSHLDMEIHEHPVLKGDIGSIAAEIDHLDLRGISHYVSKHSEYASWEAARFLATRQSNKDQWTWKQKIKYSLVNSVWSGPVFFLVSYLFLGGFRDGRRGLAFAILKASYFNQVYCRIKELEQEQGINR